MWKICDFKVSIWADARVCRYNAMRVEEPVSFHRSKCNFYQRYNPGSYPRSIKTNFSVVFVDVADHCRPLSQHSRKPKV